MKITSDSSAIVAPSPAAVPLTAEMIEEALMVAPELVAADGAADTLVTMGRCPAAVIGDMDSIASPSDWQTGTTRFLLLEEQDSTDFEKCLYASSAPFYVAAGFTGRRVDHMLAVFHAMLAHPEKRVVLLGEAGPAAAHAMHDDSLQIKIFGYDLIPMSKTTFYFAVVVLFAVEFIQTGYKRKLDAERARGALAETVPVHDSKH